MNAIIEQNRKFIKFSSIYIILYILIVSVVSLLTQNIILTFSSLIILPLTIKLVWRIHEPPVFLLIIFFHWVQISLKIFHADILGVSVDDIAFSRSTPSAIYLSLLGLLFLSFGIHLIVRTIKPLSKEKLIEEGNGLEIKKIFYSYVIFEIFNILMIPISHSMPSLSSILYTLSGLKVLVIYLLFIVSLIQKKYIYLIIVLVVETLQGFSGFFSSYKAVYFILLLAYFTINYKISIKKILLLSPLIIFLLSLTITWTAIKVDYRSLVSKGQHTQEVKVSLDKQLNIYKKLLTNIDNKKISFALEALAYRLAYVDFFGQVIDYVPYRKNYEYGGLWLGSFENIFMPRILFPNKPVLDDSIRTTKYTGIWHPSGKDGVSISLGYFAESYIDFGVFMFIPLFLLGCLYGVIYKYLLRLKTEKLYAYTLVIFILYNHYLFETRNDKLIGSLFTTLIIVLLLNKFLYRFYLVMKKRK